MPRKSRAQIRAEAEDRRSQAWSDFYGRLQRVGSRAELNQFLAQGPSPRGEGREYYSSLGFFFSNWIVPAGASSAELAEYQRLVGILDNEGSVPEGSRARLESLLDEAMERHSF